MQRLFLTFPLLFACASLQAKDFQEFGEAEQAALKQGEIVVWHAAEDKKKRFVCCAILLDEPLERVWGLIDNKEVTSEYIESVLSSKVVGREAGGATLVEQETQTPGIGKTFSYVVRHVPTLFQRVDFERVSGDLRHIEGSWHFERVTETEDTAVPATPAMPSVSSVSSVEGHAEVQLALQPAQVSPQGAPEVPGPVMPVSGVMAPAAVEAAPEEEGKTLLVYSLHINPGRLVPQSFVSVSQERQLPGILVAIRDRLLGTRDLPEADPASQLAGTPLVGPDGICLVPLVDGAADEPLPGVSGPVIALETVAGEDRQP